MPNGPLLKPDQIFQMIISSQRTDGAQIRLKNGTEIKNSSDYVIKHSVHLPDYTTNTLSYVQSSLLLNISAWENGLVSSVLSKDSLTLTETWLGTLSNKKTILFGNFSQTSDPHPPTFWEPLIQKFFLVFILHFRT